MENPALLDNPDSGKRNGHRLVVRPHYVEEFPEVREEAPQAFLLEYWDMVRHNAHILGLGAFFGVLLALLITLPQSPVYRARASLEIQNLNQNFLNMREVNPTANDIGSSPPEADLETQVQILRSESVLDRVIVKLNLANRFSLEQARTRWAAWRKVLGLTGSRPRITREELLRRVSRNLTITTEPKSRLVEIFYNSTDPQLAADFANALTAEFIQQNLDARWKTTQQTGEWLARQMEEIRIKLEKSEDKLQNYATVAGLLFTSEKDNIAEDKLRQLQEQLSQAQADCVAAQSKYESAEEAAPESLPQVLDDKTLGEIQEKLTDLRRQLAELSTTLTPAHPSVKKVQAQIAALEAAVQTKRRDFVERIQNEYRAAQRRQDLLARNYADQARLVTEQGAKVAHYNILKRDVDTNRELYESMLRSVQEAEVSSALRASNVRVVDTAFPPVHRYKPSYAINTGLGMVAGLFFGLAFVVMREHADRSIHAPGETGFSLGVPELGVIPSASAERSRYFAYYRATGGGRREVGNGKREPGQKNGDSADRTSILGLANPETGLANGRVPSQVELVAARKNGSVLADSFRATLTSILFAGENGDRPRVIVLTSAGSGEGKTTVASNLALALAEIGSPVLLIDGDLRKGRLHELFHVSNSWGLSDVLAGESLPADRESAYLETRYSRLYLLPSGPTPPSIAGLLYSPRTRKFFNHAREEYHTVIIDTPPMLNMPDARLLGKLADGVVLVIRASRTTREEAATAAERLAADGTRILGTVLNEWDPRRASHNAYTYGYPYSRVNGNSRG